MLTEENLVPLRILPESDCEALSAEESKDLGLAQENSSSTHFAKVYKSLASLVFFTPSSRRLKEQKMKSLSFTREVEGKRVEVSAEIIPSAVFGLPVTADQDKYLALQRIIRLLLQSEGKVTNPIRFKSADLLRLLNKSTKTGKNFKEISEWLDVMSSTTIVSKGTVWDAGQKRFAKDRFRVFDRAVSVGKELEDGTIADANYVWLSTWQLENINNNFLLPIELETYRKLKNHIAKALVPLLQNWLFASHKAGSFEKRYDELCEILTLQSYNVPSLILRQLRPSLDELTQHGYLEKWRIEKTNDKKAYKIILFHGPKFHRDRRKRLEQKNQNSELIAESSPMEPNLPAPGKLERPEDEVPVEASAKSGKRKKHSNSEKTGAEIRQAELEGELSRRGLWQGVASKLLEEFPPVRQTKDIGEGFLYSLIKDGHPLPGNFETRSQRQERRTSETRRQKFAVVKSALMAAYEEHRLAMVDEYIARELTVEEFERRVSDRKKEQLHQSGLWEQPRPEMVDNMARHEVRAEIAKQVNLVSFEEIRRRELPRILAECQLDPDQLGLA